MSAHSLYAGAGLALLLLGFLAGFFGAALVVRWVERPDSGQHRPGLGLALLIAACLLGGAALTCCDASMSINHWSDR